MNENKGLSLEIDLKDNNSESEKTQQFTVELLIYNNILDNENQNQNRILNQVEGNQEFIDKEMVTLDLPIYYKNKNNQNDYHIKVSDLKKQLIKKQYPIRTSKLFFYIENEYINDYAYINNDNEIIDSSMLSPDHKIKLKLKNCIDKKLIKDTFFLLKKHFSELSEKKNNSEIVPNPDVKKTEKKNENEKEIEFNKRTRKIGDIVKNVYVQRMLYNGYCNDEGAKVKYDLDGASKKIGIAKKTLDDYLKQIREAREHGFNFNEHKDKPIGYLRKFNKDKRGEEKKDNNNKGGDDNNKDNESLPLEEEN